jgi:hypothetical protein
MGRAGRWPMHGQTVFFERVLSADGYYVTDVATGRHALRCLRDTAFDLIVIDMSLPDIDGFLLQRPCCSRDLVLRDGVATAHDLELRPNGRRKFCSLLADSHCVGAPSLASAAFG